MVFKLLGLAGLVGAVGCQEMFFEGDGVRGSGHVASESRRVSGFSRIDTEGAFDVRVKVGPETSLQIKGDDNLIKLVESTVQNGTLHLSTREKISPKKDMVVTITTPRLEAFNLKGAGDVDIDGVREDKFELDLRGAGDMRISGTTRDLDISLKGAGDMNLFGLRAENVRATLKGAGDINVYATRYLKADVMGAGDLRYKGHPEKVDKSTSGIGDIEEMD